MSPQTRTTTMDESIPAAQTDKAVASSAESSSSSPAEKTARLNAPTVIDIENVDFHYGKNKALHGIHFPIKASLDLF